MADFTDAELEEMRKRLNEARATHAEAAKSKSLWDIADGYALDGMIELRIALDSPLAKVRHAAALALVQTWTRMPPRPVAMPSTAQTKEQWEAQADAAEKDPAVREFLRRRGWSEPKQGKETN